MKTTLEQKKQEFLIKMKEYFNPVEYLMFTKQLDDLLACREEETEPTENYTLKCSACGKVAPYNKKLDDMCERNYGFAGTCTGILKLYNL